MGRRSRDKPRTPSQAGADRRSDELALRLGRMLRDARTTARLTQAQAASRAGIARSTWSGLENGRDAHATLPTWNRAAIAIGSTLDAYLKRATAADRPRDAVHLATQELLIRTATGGWRALPEAQLDADARSSRSGDVLLQRTTPETDEWALFEVWDWFNEVGGPLRDWDRRMAAVERLAIARMRNDRLPRTGGCWLVRATTRNRRLIGEHRHVFLARFPGSGQAWLAAVSGTDLMPGEPVLLWVSVRGDRIFPARLRG